MYVHEQARVAYLAHPRTASTATAEALQGQAGFTELGDHHDGPRDDAAGLSRKSEVPGPEAFKGWTVITTVRNHFAVLSSWMRLWEDRSVPEQAGVDWWEKWITQKAGRHFIERRPDGSWRMFWHAPVATDVVRYRNLTVELNAVLRREDLPPVRLPDPDRAPQAKRAYRDRLSDDLRRWAERRFSDEMSRYGHQW